VDSREKRGDEMDGARKRGIHCGRVLSKLSSKTTASLKGKYRHSRRKREGEGVGKGDVSCAGGGHM